MYGIRPWRNGLSMVFHKFIWDFVNNEIIGLFRGFYMSIGQMEVTPFVYR